MAQSFIGRKRIRKRFGHITEAAVMPNLIEVQKQSYDQFLMVKSQSAAARIRAFKPSSPRSSP